MQQLDYPAFRQSLMALPPTIKLKTYSPDFNLQDSCHLWLLDIDQLTQDMIIQQQGILSDSELTRFQSLKRRQLQFIAMRAFVRKCLALYTGMHPRDLIIDAEPQGKPFLAKPTLPIKFNLSHCNNTAVLALGLQDEIGVDIESITRNRGQRKIATRYFHPQEIAQLALLNDSQHNHYFYRLWTLKEAFFKAIGTGISAGLDKAAFHLEGEAITVTLASDLQTPGDNWQFYQTFINSDFCVALARQSRDRHDIHWFDGRELFIG